MLRIKIIIALLSIAVLPCVLSELRFPNDDTLRKHWQTFKSSHDLRFNHIEERKRFLNFRENYFKVIQHNQKYYKNETNFLTSLNQFSYMTHEEYVKRLGMKYTVRNDTLNNNETISDIEITELVTNSSDNVFRTITTQQNAPESFSWLSRNAVTPVKNQFSCGSCWSFASIAVVESLYAIKYNTLKRFSEQNLIDCTYNVEGARTGLTNLGCDGGWPERAFEYIQSSGVVEESLYQYRAKEGQCQASSNKLASKPRVKISGFKNLKFGDENALKRAVYTIGPVAIGVDASEWQFASYSTGIYSSTKCDANNVNHAVVVVGYGSENGQDYWLIKNSWGQTWGSNGFMKLARNAGNMCGVASLATFAY